MQPLGSYDGEDVLGGLPSSIVTFAVSCFEADVQRFTQAMLKALEAHDVVAYQDAARALANVAFDAGAHDLGSLAHTACESAVAVPATAILAASRRAITAMKGVIVTSSPRWNRETRPL
jgi:hypothetical protein